MVSVWYYRLARKIYVAVKTYYISLYALSTKGFQAHRNVVFTDGSVIREPIL